MRDVGTFLQFAFDVTDFRGGPLLAKFARRGIISLIKVLQDLLPDLVVWVQGVTLIFIG